MTEALIRLQESMAASKPPTPFVGAGFSSAATGNADHASWRGLLLDGIKVCERVGSPMPSGWAARMKEQLDFADAVTYIAAADDITRRLRAVREGREFATWIRRTIGSLQCTTDGRRIVDAVCRLTDRRIVTTNYDTLIEDVAGWHSRTWTDEEYREALDDSQVVIHLHGVVEKPESIILSSADYERLSHEDLSKVMNQALFASQAFVFIGCGDGLNDPNIAPLLRFATMVTRERGREHYILVTGGQLRQLNSHPISERITPVAYGASFADLTQFLERLKAPERIEVSQDPGYYEDLSEARASTSLLNLAAPAWGKLEMVRDALRRAQRTLDQVVNCIAEPDGMASWDYRDQLAKHDQLATSVRGPAARLQSYMVQLAAAISDAHSNIGQLSSAAFSNFTPYLEPMTREISELESLVWQLRSEVAVVRNDLGRRTGLYAGYRVPSKVLNEAHEAADHAHDIASSLRDGLVPPAQETAVSEVPDLRVVPDGPESGPDDVTEPVPDDALPGRDDEIPEVSVRVVPLVGEIGAGHPTLPGQDEVRDYLALPGQHLPEGEVFMLEVQGESMTGEDGVLPGDYVIVDPHADWQDGDMVAIALGSDEGAGVVKRFWREGPSHIRLESSNPAYGPRRYSEIDAPTVLGKVVGITRWHVRKGRRRPESSD